VKKARFFYFHEEANDGKLAALEALQVEYRRYLQACVETMLREHRMHVPRGELLRFFPKESVLSTNLVSACQQHAVEIIKGWTAAKYTTTIKNRIKFLAKDGSITEAEKIQLFMIGKYSYGKPSETVSQKALDFYWSMLLDPEVCGRTPTISNRIGMRLNVHTADLRKLDETKIASWWLGFSNLKRGRKIQVPLKSNPFVKSPEDIVHGCMVRKDQRGRWQVGVLEKKVIEEPKLDLEAPRVGVDVGLNVMAATSDGRLYGADIKPKFDALYSKVRDLRANRQRQGFKDNSPKLDRLEDKLSGLIKTATGNVANKLVKSFPGVTFVIEDLDLRGCRGQKRFAYRALHHSLGNKAPCLAVNPAYTSQMCPSCGYVSRSNREGVKFHCRACGRLGHADVIGGLNLLGRSEDKEVRLDDDPSAVKEVLRRRFAQRRSPVEPFTVTALVASSRRLTVGVPDGSSTASNAS
jgi:hypothetical protein